jgi:hypothetical protein
MSSLQKALVREKKSSLQSALAKEMIQNGGGGKPRARKNPPTVTTAYSSSGDDDDSSSSSSSSSSDDDSDHEQSSADMMKIRQQAIKLVNTPTVGPHADYARSRQGPQTFVSPYQQQQSAGERPTASSSARAANVSSYQSSSTSSSGYQYAMHDPSAHAQARTAEPLSVTSMVVNCVSEVCKSSTSELVSKVLSSGYKSVANYESPPVNGNWGEIDTSQHGYGNGNRAPAFAQPSNSNRGSGSGKNGFANMPKYQD